MPSLLDCFFLHLSAPLSPQGPLAKEIFCFFLIFDKRKDRNHPGQNLEKKIRTNRKKNNQKKTKNDQKTARQWLTKSPKISQQHYQKTTKTLRNKEKTKTTKNTTKTWPKKKIQKNEQKTKKITQQRTKQWPNLAKMIKTMAKNDQTMRKPNDQINEH